jgi:BMFP domain-containing protein YqiC
LRGKRRLHAHVATRKLAERPQRVQIPCQCGPAALLRGLRPSSRGRCTILERTSRPCLESGQQSEALNMDSFRIDDIVRRLLERVPPALRSMQADLESNFRAVLRERLTKLDLVSRDEFDAQARVLERTRARLEALEARLAALEGGAAVGAAGGTPGSGSAPER